MGQGQLLSNPNWIKNKVDDIENKIKDNVNGLITIDTNTTTEGMVKSYTIKQGDTVVGVIDIPKDMVVEDGSVVVNPEGQEEGTYIKLILANVSEALYINVGTLVDIYRAKANATQIQISIDSSTREISATIVAGGVGTTELADNAVTTVKIADANITLAKLSADIKASLAKADTAVQSISEGTTNGTIEVDGTEVKVHGLGSAAYTNSDEYEKVGAASTVQGNLDTEVTRAKAAEAQVLADTKSYTDSKTSTIQANLDTEIERANAAEAKTLEAAKNYTDSKIGDVDTTGAASTVQANLNTEIERAKAAEAKALSDAKSYTDTKISTVNNSITTHNSSTTAHNDIRELITGLTNRLNALADSDDTTLDQMSEVVAYIKANKALIESVTTSKVNVSDIINNLTTNSSNKVLSAAQGVAIKSLITALETSLNSHTGNKSNPHGVTKSQVGLGNVPNVATNDQTPTYTVASSNANLTSGEKLSVAFGKIAKAISSLISHLADTVSHITSTERTNWNTVSNKVDKVSGKGLSTNDFTDTLKSKLDGIASGANKYTHPTSGVTAGTYRNVTVDANGHVTKGTNPTTLSGYGITDAESKGSVNTHNNSSTAHSDIRKSITDIQDSLKGILVPLMLTDWVENTKNNTFTQTISIEGLDGDFNPFIVLNPAGNEPTVNESESFACITGATINDGSIVFTADEKPAISFTVIVKNVIANDIVVADTTALVGRIGELETEINELNSDINYEIYTGSPNLPNGVKRNNTYVNNEYLFYGVRYNICVFLSFQFTVIETIPTGWVTILTNLPAAVWNFQELNLFNVIKQERNPRAIILNEDDGTATLKFVLNKADTDKCPIEGDVITITGMYFI
jgi:hypothetical protein